VSKRRIAFMLNPVVFLCKSKNKNWVSLWFKTLWDLFNSLFVFEDVKHTFEAVKLFIDVTVRNILKRYSFSSRIICLHGLNCIPAMQAYQWVAKCLFRITSG